jgi:hypothetical protein
MANKIRQHTHAEFNNTKTTEKSFPKKVLEMMSGIIEE